MDEIEQDRDWREAWRDELLPYAAFYGLGLLWLSVAGTLGAWSDGLRFALLAITATFGIPVTGLVSLMMVWRVTLIGIDAGRVVPMVVAVSVAVGMMIAAFGAVFPALALGHSIGQLQRTALERAAGVPDKA